MRTRSILLAGTAVMGMIIGCFSDPTGQSCPPGSSGCECAEDFSCEPGLTCMNGSCNAAGGTGETSGDGDGDGDGAPSGDGDGESPGDGDGDGDGDGEPSGDGGEGNCCNFEPKDQACDVGLSCTPGLDTEQCVDGACCTWYCSLLDPNFDCGTPGDSCVKFFIGPEPAGLEWLGFCSNL